MNFIYAVDNESVLNAAVLERTGLGRVLAEPSKAPAVTSTIGPGGSACLLLGNVKAGQLRYKPDVQQWMKSYNQEYYIGFYLEDPPKPAELARKKQLAGHAVELGGGYEWLIPVARKFAEGSVLPVSLGIGKNGEIVTDELTEYVGFSGRAEKYYRDTLRQWDRIEGCDEMTTDGRIKLAIEAIMLNYHVGIEETFALKLINTANLHEICEAIIDLPTVIEVNKQMQADKKKD